MNDEQRKIRPTPAAVAFASRITEAEFKDVFYFAHLIDQVADDAAASERKRIFTMSFTDLWREFWRGRRLYEK